ncbi:MAG: Uma2 family endonuclease [Chloroflexi bacterium]|nr:Uma2 family endonuclease [Ktedonobacteraceae bacterium]MBV9708400.1 Uma2 family endonuclease [Chloroflexota bacterium]
MQALHWNSHDLALLPDNGKRYEIVDGELYVSKQPHYHHQFVCVRLAMFLQMWSDQTQAGEANFAPGLIFADDDDVAPDVVWTSQQRLRGALQADGKLHTSPELVIEVLSPGSENTRRDREVKLKLYSRRGVDEYWVVNWQERRLEIYRREKAKLTLHETLNETDILQSPLLPGFNCQVKQLFSSVSRL